MKNEWVEAMWDRLVSRDGEETGQKRQSEVDSRERAAAILASMVWVRSSASSASSPVSSGIVDEEASGAEYDGTSSRGAAASSSSDESDSSLDSTNGLRAVDNPFSSVSLCFFELICER